MLYGWYKTVHIALSYDENSNNTSTLYANGMLTELTYTPGNMVESITVKQENSNSFDYKELYEYNLQGNLVEKVIYENPEWDPIYDKYTYNSAGMLTSESYGYSYFEHWKNDYSYDNRGNRTSLTKTIYGSDFEKGVTYTYDLNNRLISYATDNAYADDFTTAYTYDANGNTLTEASNGVTKSYGYDLSNRLIGFNDGTNTASYTYHPNGLRKTKQVNSGAKTTFNWNQNAEIVAEVDNISNTYIYRLDCQI